MKGDKYNCTIFLSKKVIFSLYFIFLISTLKLSSYFCFAKGGPDINIRPVSKCEIGSYRSSKGPWNACSGFKDCDIGCK